MVENGNGQGAVVTSSQMKYESGQQVCKCTLYAKSLGVDFLFIE